MLSHKKLISVVIPCFNEEDNVYNTFQEVKNITDRISHYDFEILFVDNGSEDESARLMTQLAKQEKNVTTVLLSRNFGPEMSGLAGLNHACGDAVILMAADLQDPPQLIPDFIKKWEEGYDIVLGKVLSTQDNKLMLALRRGFYALLKKISYLNIPVNVSGFGLIDKKVNEAIISIPEKSRFYRGLLALVGFKQTVIPFVRPARKFGKTSYNLRRYLQHAEKGLFGFTTLPLDVITFIGIFLVGLSFTLILIYVLLYFFIGNPITASASLFLAVLFFGSTQILAISIVGKYIGIIFEETKNRPPYFIKKIISRHSESEAIR